MAGNRILMDFVISSKRTSSAKTLPFLLALLRICFRQIFLPFTWKIASFVGAIDIFATEVLHKVDGLIKLAATRAER